MAEVRHLTRIRLTGDLYNPQCPPDYLNCARPRRYSNPNKMEGRSEKERLEVVVKFRDQLMQGLLNFDIEEFVAVIDRVGYTGLACWCRKEELCHCDILIKAYETFKKHGAWPLDYNPKIAKEESVPPMEIPVQEGMI